MVSVKEGQVFQWLFDVKCRDKDPRGFIMPKGSRLRVIKRTHFNPYNEIGPNGHNWLCEAANGITVWATLESCLERNLLTDLQSGLMRPNVRADYS